MKRLSDYFKTETPKLMNDQAFKVDPPTAKVDPPTAAEPMLPPAPPAAELQITPKQYLASAIAALLVPQGAQYFLQSPGIWLARAKADRARQAENAWKQQMDLERLRLDELRARSPYDVARIESSGRDADRDLRRRELDEIKIPEATASIAKTGAETERLQVEVPKISSETDKTRAETARILQDNSLEPLERYAKISNELWQTYGGENATPEAQSAIRGALAEIAKVLNLTMPQIQETGVSRAQQEADADIRLKDSSTLLNQQSAETERVMRSANLAKTEAQTRLIRAQELTERQQPAILQARLRQIDANIAQGWRSLNLQEAKLNEAIRSNNTKTQRELYDRATNQIKFWVQQRDQLKMAAGEQRNEFGVLTRKYANSSEFAAKAQEADQLVQKLVKQLEPLAKKLNLPYGELPAVGGHDLIQQLLNQGYTLEEVPEP